MARIFHEGLPALALRACRIRSCFIKVSRETASETRFSLVLLEPARMEWQASLIVSGWPLQEPIRECT